MFRAFTRPRYQVSVYRTIGPLVVCVLISYEKCPLHLGNDVYLVKTHTC